MQLYHPGAAVFHICRPKCAKNGFNTVKAAALFGGNNSGKTCLVRAIRCIRDVLLGKAEDADITPYRCGDSKVCPLGVEFLHEGRAYRYEFRYDASEDTARRGFIYERFQELGRDGRGHVKAKEMFLRDTEKSRYRINGYSSEALRAVPRDRILIYGPGMCGSSDVKGTADILTGFAGTVDVICMKDIPLERTVQVLKYNEPIRERVVKLITSSDIGIEDYAYVSPNGLLPDTSNGKTVCPEDLSCLVSVHKGHPVQSLSFDSDGALKLIALASYIIDAVEGGRVLVVDEIDSSLHYKLTRAILSSFMLDSNVCGQLICTTQDVDLLDIQWLFRKDQIWFTANHEDYEDEYTGEMTVEDKDMVRLYCLNEFKDLGNGMDADSYLMDKYSTGNPGSVQHPDYSELII